MNKTVTGVLALLLVVASLVAPAGASASPLLSLARPPWNTSSNSSHTSWDGSSGTLTVEDICCGGGQDWSAGLYANGCTATCNAEIQVTISTLGDFMFGFTSNLSWVYSDMKYAFYSCQNYCGGRLDIWENGNGLGGYSSVTVGDVLSVKLTDGVVTYLKNGNIVHTSTVAPTYPLRPVVTFNRNTGVATSITDVLVEFTDVPPTSTPTLSPTPLPQGSEGSHGNANNLIFGGYGGLGNGNFTDENCTFEEYHPFGGMFDLGGWYTITELNSLFQGKSSGAGEGYQWFTSYDLTEWVPIVGAASPELLADGWVSNSPSGLVARYLRVARAGPSWPYFCFREIQIYGIPATMPTATYTPTSTPTEYVAVPTLTPTSPPGTSTPTITPGGPTLTPTYTRTPSPTPTPGGPTPTRTRTPIGSGAPPSATPTPVPGSAPLPPGTFPASCGDMLSVVVNPPEFGPDGIPGSATFENFNCVLVAGRGDWLYEGDNTRPLSTHDANYTWFRGSSVGAFDDGWFLNRNNGGATYLYEAHCTVTTTGAPLAGNCGNLDIFGSKQTLDIYYSVGSVGSFPTSTPPATVTPGGSPTVPPSPSPGFGAGCGAPGQPPCRVIQVTPFPTVTCGQAGQPPCNVQIVGTPMPVATITCGQPGQPPCSVVIAGSATSTPYGYGNYPTVVAMLDNGVPDVALTGGGGAGDGGFAFPYPASTSAYLPENALSTKLWDGGCPINVDLLGRELHVCIKVQEIEALNVGPIGIPLTVVVVVLGLIVFGWFMKG